MKLRERLKRRKVKKDYRRIFFKLGSALLLAVAVIYSVLHFWQPVTAAPTTKPSVLIYKFRNLASSSADAMATALGSTNYNVTVVTTLPTVAQANNYDVVIFSAGSYNFATALTNDEKNFLNNYLNSTGNKGRLIIEGEQIVNIHRTDNTVMNDILKLTGFSAAQSPGKIQITNTTHPVTHGLSTSAIDYSASASFRAASSTGTNLARWDKKDAPQYVLSSWEGPARKRLVFIGFRWSGWSNTTARNNLINNAVKWSSEFVEVQLTNRAPASVNPGASGVKMAQLTFSSYANAKNNNSNTIIRFSVQQTGNATHNSVKDIRLYNSDHNGNPIGNHIAQAIFESNGKAEFTGLNLVIGVADKHYVLAYDIAKPADEGKNLRLRLGPVTDIVTLEGSPVKIHGGNESSAVLINNITPPAVPQEVFITNPKTGNSLRLDWKANTDWDLQGYKIYRAVDSGSGMGNFTLLTTTTQNWIVDNGLNEFYRYYYKVVAYDTAANDSAYSKTVMGIPNRVPAIPTGLSVTNPASGHKLNLSWNAVVGEPNDPFNGNTPDLAGYNLYAGTSSGGPYNRVNDKPITGTTYTHAGLKNGITYYYKIVSVDRYGLESNMSSHVSAVPSDTTPPTIVSTYPAEGQDYVETNVTIRVKFDELLNISGDISNWIKLEQRNLDNTYTVLPGTVGYNPGTYELTFKPDSDLTTVGNFRVTVQGGEPNGVRSYASNPYMESTKIWTFGTLLNPHADFENNNTLCGYCHSAHSATGQQIIRAPKILDLCFMCHDGTGSSYDVKAGRYNNGERIVPLAAGGYDLALGSTSTHFTDLDNYVFGSPGLIMQIDCNTCHEPHGSGNFRLVRTNINGVPINLQAIVYGPAYNLRTASGYEITTYIDGWEQFCGACHGEYQEYHSVTTITGEENWRHRTGVPLTGGTEGGRWTVEFPQPGLYTTLPTLGPPTGAHLTNYTILTGGSLAPNTYNYIVTGLNAEGESAYGSIMQVQNPSAGSRIKIEWERIETAYKYRVYRYTGTGNPEEMDASQFRLLAELPDTPQSFIDTGAYGPQAQGPPLVSNSRITCITCHFVHGTPAIAENGEHTRLRRYDNDGICQDCHKK